MFNGLVSENSAKHFAFKSSRTLKDTVNEVTNRTIQAKIKIKIVFIFVTENCLKLLIDTIRSVFCFFKGISSIERLKSSFL